MEGSLLHDPSSPYSNLLNRMFRFIALYGGRDSAKSWSIAEYLIRRATTEPIFWLCTREFQTSVRDSVHRLLVNTIFRLGLQGWFTTSANSITSKAGAEFIFRGLHHNIIEVKGTEGLDGMWIEEGQSLTKESLDIVVPTLRKEGSQLICSWNVTDEDAPVHQYFIVNPPPDSYVRQVNYDENPFLSSITRKTIEHMMATDFPTYEHIYKGIPKKFSEALVLGGKYVVEAFPDDLWRKADRIFQGLDFGFANDPNAFTRSFVHDNILHIEYEAGGVGIELEDIGPMMTGEIPSDHPDKARAQKVVDKQFGSVPRNHAAPVREWPIKCDNARPETISFLRGKGFRTEAAEKWNGSVEDGIAHLKSFRVIKIHPRCKETAQEARVWAYKVDRITREILPVLVDKNNHYWDGIRYGMDGYIQRRGGLGVWAALGKK